MPRSQWLPWVVSWALDLARVAAAEGATLSTIVEILQPDAEATKVPSEAECVVVAGHQSRAAEARMLRCVLMIAALLPRNAAGAEVAL